MPQTPFDGALVTNSVKSARIARAVVDSRCSALITPFVPSRSFVVHAQNYIHATFCCPTNVCVVFVFSYTELIVVLARNSSGVRKTKRCTQRQKTGLGHTRVNGHSNYPNVARAPSMLQRHLERTQGLQVAILVLNDAALHDYQTIAPALSIVIYADTNDVSRKRNRELQCYIFSSSND